MELGGLEPFNLFDSAPSPGFTIDIILFLSLFCRTLFLVYLVHLIAVAFVCLFL